MASIDAWIAEGSRLLNLAAASTKDRRAITEAIDKAATLLKKATPRPPPTRAQVKRQRPSPLDAGIATGATEQACYFLDHRSLCALRACGSGVRAVASSDRIWSLLTAREFPETAQLQSAGLLATGALDRRTYERFSGLWKGDFTEGMPRPPGPDAYRAIVKIEHGDKHAEGVCELAIVQMGFHIDASALWAAMLPLTSSHGRAEAFEIRRTPLLQVSVSIVRISDGKCLHIGTRLAADDVSHEHVILAEFGRRSGRPTSHKSLLRSFGAGMLHENLVDVFDVSDMEHFVVLESCRIFENSLSDSMTGNFLLERVGEFVLAMWDPVTVQDSNYVEADRLLSAWHASAEWC